MKDLVKYVKFYAHPVEYLNDFWKYEGEDGEDLYVPTKTERCKFCRGRGRVYHNITDDDEEVDYCDDCEGEGYIDNPQYNLVMTADEHTEYARQQRYLRRRYGCVPPHIRDYWERAS